MSSGTPVDQAELRQDEAVLLAHALVARLAEGAGARVLFIKGPTAVAQGVRPPRGSSDVDVLVDPSAFEDVRAAMESAGWQLRSPIGVLRYAGDFAFDHSAHYIHTEWPIDVDVHYNFPGFLADPTQVFEALWARRTTVSVAARPVPVPDELGQALVVGLHALRDPTREQSLDDLALIEARTRSWTADTLDQLTHLAMDTGCTGSAAPLLAAAGLEPADDPALAPRLAQWRSRQLGHGLTTMWLVELRRAPLRAKPAVLRRALLPPREHFASSHLTMEITPAQLRAMHLRRWGRAARSLPGALRRSARLR